MNVPDCLLHFDTMQQGIILCIRWGLRYIHLLDFLPQDEYKGKVLPIT